MAPTPKNKPAKKLGALEEAPEKLLQAVVVADSFNKRFRPLTLETPRATNTPVLEYTLEFLALGGVEEVFLYCYAHSEKIRSYIKSSKWSRESSPFEIHVIYSPSITSVGDVMRELDQSRLINDDFIFVSGDIVSNISLQTVLQEHKARRLVDKSCIMTTVLREVSPSHRSRPRGENAVFVMDSNRERIFHYEPLKQSPPTESVALPKDLVKANPKMSLQENLLDCCIDIISFEVPPLFTENFDWQHSRKDFLHGILMDELYGKTVYAHILKSGYAGRIQSLHTYDSIGRDITNRWTYPFCPDSNFLDGQSYKYSRGHMYKEADVILAQSAEIKENTIIGSGTKIEDGAIVFGSTIGRNCHIGQNVKLHSAIIWDNAVIGDNCTIGKAIIASGVHINSGCIVESGAIISYGVEVEKGSRILSSAKLTKASGGKESKNSRAKTITEYEDSEDDEEEQVETSMAGLYSWKNVSESDFSDMSDIDEDAVAKKRGHKRTNSESEIDGFPREAYNSLLGALKQNHSVDIMILELNGLRMSANAEFNDVRLATSSAVVSYMLTKITSNEAVSKIVDATIEKLLPLFNRMIFEVSDQAEILEFMQKELAGKERGGAIMQAIGMKLYNEDLCDNDGILTWWNDGNGPDGETPDMAKVREATTAFVKWVMQQDEDSDDEDEDYEEDDDDD
ncbi:hypothetical protein H072_586 [Dactylellina haptotyla CBS 200.50]|uniref:Translation initiation factor eIF2B subunit epsilon n=1 Tax=Dactylellina haptotyla (strain CBS 200.50) TaxID=1284197 RepID=S8ARG5_DACHA|nr:hypothetical protein H072_586 [Dactylellina haptotyla CBS 200.50]